MSKKSTAARQARALRTPALAPLAMIAGVLAVYVRPAFLTSHAALLGLDYFQLHYHRIRYALAALHAHPLSLPGWFTREVLGTPFAANIQSFPWIPTRLFLLLLEPTTAYVFAVALSASLTAWFTYLFARSARLSPWPAAAAGWTFACCGFFASRMMAGHLAIIEAFPALPCLLWLAGRFCETERGGAGERRALLALSLAAACFAVSGHPQIPAYAMIAACAYVVWRDRTRALRAGTGIALGCGLTLFCWWPVLRFVARSSRVLLAGRPTNDVVFPWWRLKAFVVPWKDGWMEPVVRQPIVPFVDLNRAVFWDTVCYAGVLPLAAAAFVAFLILRKRAVDEKVRFALLAGAIGLVVALPPIGTFLSSAPVVVFRSSSRLLYFTEFALALAMAAALDRWLVAGSFGRLRGARGLAVVLLAAHVADVSLHAGAFVRAVPLPLVPTTLLEPFFSSTKPGERVAIDHTIPTGFNRVIDDVGFYDSLMPAHTYEALMALRGDRDLPSLETFDASDLKGPVLEQLGVRMVVTQRKNPEMEAVRRIGSWNVYVDQDPVPRWTFVPADRVRYLPDADILASLRTHGLDLRSGMLLPAKAGDPRPAAPPRRDQDSGTEAALKFDRPSSDEIVIAVATPVEGFVRVTESWDSGWHAFLDDRPTELLRAEGFLMAVHVPAGPHTIRLRFTTPGVWGGVFGSLVSLVLLAGVAWKFPRRRS